MICLIRTSGAGPYWARYRRHAEARFHTNLLLALTIALLLRDRM